MFDKFDEYKFFAESTQVLADRRQAATQTYLTVNTAIFSIFAFLSGSASGDGLLWVSIPLFVIGFLACATWIKLIQEYKRLIGWRYDQLMEIEAHPKMKGSHQFYLKEKKNFYSNDIKGKISFSKLETALPRFFSSHVCDYDNRFVVHARMKVI